MADALGIARDAAPAQLASASDRSRAEALAPPRQLPPATNGHATTPPRPPGEAPPNRTYRGRFAVGYAVLIALLAAAGYGAYYFTQHKSHKTTSVQHWSRWHPSFSGELGAIEIARHVAHHYRHPNGHELVGIIASRPHVETQGGPIPVEALLVRPSDAQFPNDEIALGMGNSMVFNLCGNGESCAIAEGEASVERAALLRREALELALYTMHYDPSIDNVVAFLPPRQGQPPSFVLVFSRRELRQYIGLPLKTTLPTRNRQTIDNYPSSERQRVDNLAASSLYVYKINQAPDGNYYYELDPYQL